MKIKTTEAAQSLGIHPSHLLLHVARLESTLTFQDVWPEIDNAWVETVATTGGHRSSTSGPLPEPTKPSTPVSSLSDYGIHVLDKLCRQGKWGNVSVSFDALLNLTHVPKRNLEEVIDELRKRGLLDHDGKKRGTISLNPSRQKDIESLVQQTPGTLRG
jgi:hypothetical protein